MNSEISSTSTATTTLRKEYKALFRLGTPVLVTQLGVIVVSFADTMMVGAYGLDELASAAFVNSIFMIPIVMLMGFASGITPLVGALFGRGKKKEAGAVMRSGLQMNLLTSVCFTVIMGIIYFFIPCFGQPPELLPLIRTYYLIVMATMIPMSVFNCLQQVSNGITDTSTPMWIILGCNILNIIGNYILIFGKYGAPEMGLAGAGISTLFARTAGAAAILCVFMFSRRRRVYWRGMAIRSGRGLRRLTVWQTSYPVMIQNGVECGLWTFGAIVSGWFGKVQLASYQVVNTIAQLGFMIFISIGVAVSVRIANYTGRKLVGNIRIAARAALHINLLLATLASTVFFFLGHRLIACFTDEASVVACASLLIPPLILYQFGDATQLTYANALRGTSYVRPLLFISLTAYLIIGIPTLLLFAMGFNMGNLGVYYSFSISLFLAAWLLQRSFRRSLRRI